MTQIKATLLTGGNHIETVSFPCSDDEIMRLTEQNEVGHKATVFINNLVGPKGLKSMEGTYANIHELNYLAKRMDSFDGTEMGKLLAAASRFDTRDLRQLINYTFNLGRITLIQNISDMQTVGVEHYMDIHGGSCSNEEYRDPKRAEEGRALLSSKRGIWTDYGLMFINDEVVAKVAKKVLAILAGDKNGRKFLGYVVGIALFIVLLPVIAVYGLFGWMAGGGATEIVSPDMVYSAMPAEYRERMEQYNAELSIIETTFAECGVSETDTSLAKTIYISCLIGKESEENFYRTFADCFLNADEEHDPLQNISSAFGVTFTDADKERLKQLYGGYT